jgi:hypothetical protein
MDQKYHLLHHLEPENLHQNHLQGSMTILHLGTVIFNMKMEEVDQDPGLCMAMT